MSTYIYSTEVVRVCVYLPENGQVQNNAILRGWRYICVYVQSACYTLHSTTIAPLA